MRAKALVSLAAVGWWEELTLLLKPDLGFWYAHPHIGAGTMPPLHR